MIPKIRETPGMTHNGAARQSKVAMEWIWYMEPQLQKQFIDQGASNWQSLKIRHAYNNSERECVVSTAGGFIKAVDGYMWNGAGRGMCSSFTVAIGMRVPSTMPVECTPCIHTRRWLTRTCTAKPRPLDNALGRNVCTKCSTFGSARGSDSEMIWSPQATNSPSLKCLRS